MNCSDCKHEKHRAGECGNCNCGESEICHPLNRFVFSAQNSDTVFVEMQGKSAEVVSDNERATRY